jgi:SNF2 family DNA or RNA helicase
MLTDDTLTLLYGTRPYRHQEEILTRTLDAPFHAFFMEMGTGKSKVLIDTISNLFLRGKLRFALILAPKGVYFNWSVKELPDHMPAGVKYRVIVWHATPTVAQKAEMRSVSEPFDGLTIFVMNIEALSSERGARAAAWLGDRFGAHGLVAVDESTTIKTPGAARTKAALSVAKKFSVRRILSGSPSTRSPLDLWAQAEFLSPGLLAKTHLHFRARYAVLVKRPLPGGKSFQQVVGYRHMEELAARVKTWSSRILKKDCLDLPEKIYTVRNVELTPEQRQHYRDMKNLALTELRSGQLVTAPMAVTKLLRLQQILCGHLPNEIGEGERIPSNRAGEVVQVARETEDQIIVWCKFRQDIRIVTEALEREFGPGCWGSYEGDTRQEDRQRVVNDFQSGKLRFFVGNLQTASKGITLTAAQTVIYYTNSASLDDRLQSEDRAHRIGQRNAVTYVDLVAPGTVDERLLKLLRSKIELSAAALGEEVMRWLETDKI